MALAIQDTTEEIVFRLVRTTREITDCAHLVLAGGVGLNSIANGKVLKSGLFRDIWVQPAAGDAGGSVGAAPVAFHIWQEEDAFRCFMGTDLDVLAVGSVWLEKKRQNASLAKSYKDKYELD